LALGNPNLELEEIATWEIGYSGILGGEFFLTADYYQSDLENFVTDLLPGVNSIFTPYQSPIALPPNVQAGLFGFLQAALGNNFVGLTNQANGSPAIVVSYANAGSAESQGVDLGLNWYVTPQWNVSASYSWFDFEVISQQLGDRLLPNSPENSYSVGVAYAGDSFDIGVTGRFVEAFDWAAGVFQGPIPSYEVFNLSANYHFNDHWSIGLNVANMLDDEHYEAFGGDLLGRRALGSVKFGW
jgi:outer membrane receptor protein involved in Fe transport